MDEVRLLTTRVVVEPPVYQGVTVVARVRASARVDAVAGRGVGARGAGHLVLPGHRRSGGHGWPFGRTVHIGEVYGVVQSVDGVDLVEEARLYAADPVSGDRGEAAQRIELQPNALVFSYEHQVRVLPGGPR